MLVPSAERLTAEPCACLMVEHTCRYLSFESGDVARSGAARRVPCDSTKRLSQDGTCGFRPISARKTEVPGEHDRSPLTTITGSVPAWNVLHRSHRSACGDSLTPVSIERI